MTHGQTIRVANQLAQPVELHFTTGVLVLPPYGSIALAIEFAISPQLLRLERDGIVQIQQERSPESRRQQTRSRGVKPLRMQGDH